MCLLHAGFACTCVICYWVEIMSDKLTMHADKNSSCMHPGDGETINFVEVALKPQNPNPPMSI